MIKLGTPNVQAMTFEPGKKRIICLETIFIGYCNVLNQTDYFFERQTKFISRKTRFIEFDKKGF